MQKDKIKTATIWQLIPKEDRWGELSDNLIIGEYYCELPNEQGVKQTLRPVQYCGAEMHKGELRHSFWDRRQQLEYFLDPERVRPLSDQPAAKKAA